MEEKIKNEINNKTSVPNNLFEFKKLIESYGGIKKLNLPGIKKSYLILYFISLFKDKDELEKYVFDQYLDEYKFKNIGIKNYESLGDIQGSSIIQNEQAISFAVKTCIEKAIKENIKHLEIRCSPINYTKEGLSEIDVLKIILEQLEYYSNKISLSLIIIASRHRKISELYKNIELISAIYENEIKDKEIKRLFTKFFKGIDLAGDESKGNFEEIRMAFLRAMNYNINITIHAGETRDDESISKAIYYLNAERIGHGLTLVNNMSLLNKIKERKIAIELCPSSNYQINNFYDNYFDSILNNNDYPLKYYLDSGIRVTVNTDNMGISRTNITNELLKAARLTKDGLTLWEILKILKMGFKSSFVDFNKRTMLYKEAEKDIDNFIESFISQKNNISIKPNIK